MLHRGTVCLYCSLLSCSFCFKDLYLVADLVFQLWQPSAQVLKNQLFHRDSWILYSWISDTHLSLIGWIRPYLLRIRFAWLWFKSQACHFFWICGFGLCLLSWGVNKAAVGSEALNMERSGGINNMRLPTSPMSFPSSNINIPGSLVLDGSASIQHLSPQQQQQAGQGSVPMGENNYSHIDKKPRLDVKQEDMLQQQQFLHQLIQRQDLAGRNPQLQALLQQQRQRQQQILHSNFSNNSCWDSNKALNRSSLLLLGRWWCTCIIHNNDLLKIALPIGRSLWLNTSHLVQINACACHSTQTLGNMRLACFHRHLRISGSVIFAEPSLEKDLVRELLFLCRRSKHNEATSIC